MRLIPWPSRHAANVLGRDVGHARGCCRQLTRCQAAGTVAWIGGCCCRAVGCRAGGRGDGGREQDRARRLDGATRRRRHEGDLPRRAATSNLGTGRGRATSPARTSAPGAGPAPSALPAAAAGVRLAAVGPNGGMAVMFGCRAATRRGGCWSVFGSRVPGNPLGAGRRANGELGWAPGTRPQVPGPGPKATGPGRLQYLLQWSLAEPHCLLHMWFIDRRLVILVCFVVAVWRQTTLPRCSTHVVHTSSTAPPLWLQHRVLPSAVALIGDRHKGHLPRSELG